MVATEITEITEIIDKYLTELRNNGLVISKVFLFGSHAYGEPTKDSDIDLLIISPQFDEENNEKYSAKLWLATEAVDYIVEPIGVSEEVFNSNQFSPLLDLVKTKGLEIAA